MLSLKFAVWAIGTLLNDPGPSRTAAPHVQEENSSIVPVYAPSARGTGFFIEIKGLKLLVTAAHVCGTTPALLSPRGLHRVLLVRPDKDVCIATTYQGVTTLEIGQDSTAGEAVKMVGFPGDLIYDVQYGKALEVGPSRFHFEEGYYGAECPQLSMSMGPGQGCDVFVTTFAYEILARGGNSGGPIVNATTGKVVGMVIGGDTSGTYGVATPISEILGLIHGNP